MEKKRHNYPPSQSIADDEIVILDSRRHRIFAPPNKSQRPFEADYTNGVKAGDVDREGNLLVDRNNRPFNPGDKIFGRRTLGGDDVRASHKDFRELIKRLLGKPIKVVPRQQLNGSAAIEYFPNTNTPKDLNVADNLDLSKSRSKHIINHEGSHLVDILMGRAPMPPAVEKEAQSVYSTLATGKENLPKLTLPTDHNYSGPDIRNELVGEVIRAALYNPNFMKTDAPKTYEWLADLFVKNPHLGVRLNSLGAATVVALGAMGQKDKSEAAETPSERDSQTSYFRGAGPLGEPFAPVKSADEPTKKSANALVELKKALYRRGLHVQTPKNENDKNLVRALVNLHTRKKSQFYGGSR